MVDQAKADQFGKELGFGGYGGEFTVGDHKMVMTCDGVGTKLHIAEQLQCYDTIGIDLVAMCANDLVCCGATPLTFMDYYATGELDLDKSHSILDGIRVGCKIAGCELTGGETAQLQPMFVEDQWFDLAGFMVGEVLGEWDPAPIKTGDYLVGLPSSGFHSNGFTDVRKHYDDVAEWMLTPTTIYAKEVLSNMSIIKSCAHITGGGIHGNIPRALNGHDYLLTFNLSEFWVHVSSVMNKTTDEMLNKFNCGCGMVLVMSDPSKLHDMPDTYDYAVIGRVL
jgi:phosphoribosylformylglycinamidine cyclo-ligase